mmetsp:Transcript_22568/g.85495  ORF Transcript_22568/g.85495 Transcript_22568/m.85495 type:complete len:360 (-) Transcript_22568:4258-5337(-)
MCLIGVLNVTAGGLRGKSSGMTKYASQVPEAYGLPSGPRTRSFQNPGSVALGNTSTKGCGRCLIFLRSACRRRSRCIARAPAHACVATARMAALRRSPPDLSLNAVNEASATAAMAASSTSWLALPCMTSMVAATVSAAASAAAVSSTAASTPVDASDSSGWCRIAGRRPSSAESRSYACPGLNCSNDARVVTRGGVGGDSRGIVVRNTSSSTSRWLSSSDSGWKNKPPEHLQSANKSSLDSVPMATASRVTFSFCKALATSKAVLRFEQVSRPSESTRMRKLGLASACLSLRRATRRVMDSLIPSNSAVSPSEATSSTLLRNSSKSGVKAQVSSTLVPKAVSDSSMGESYATRRFVKA